MRRTVAAIALSMLALAVVPASPAGAAKPPRTFYGVVPQNTPTGSDIARLGSARVGTLRLQFHFSAVQQVDGTCQPEAQELAVCSWSALDTIVGRAAQAGTRVFPVLTADTPPLKGAAKRRWKAFVTAAAKRYGPNGLFWRSYGEYGPPPLPITEWQVFNEPNSRQFWPGPPDAGEYARLLQATTRSLRKADPQAEVVLAGMFGDAKVPLVDYLRQLYRVKGVERYFDSIALHPYARTIGGLERQIRETRRAARRGGDGKARLFLTELGWSSEQGGHPLMKGRKGQATMLKRSFRLLARKRGEWKIDGVTWYALRDSKNKHLCKFCRKAGLLNRRGKPKPAFHAFEQVAG
jgi:hypothetical protein